MAASLLLAGLTGPAAIADASEGRALEPDKGSAAATGGRAGQIAVSRNIGTPPPMGWNSYNRFGLGVTAQLVREIADGMKKYQLDDAGYKYLVIDDGWQSKQTGPKGELLCAQDKFPDGIAPLVKYVKNLGMELGIYSSPNPCSCGGRPGSLGYEDLHAKQFADWGVKFVKYDYCPTRSKERDLPGDAIIQRYQVFHAAVQKHDPGMIVAICEKGWAGSLYQKPRNANAPPLSPERRRAAFDWCAQVGVMWRTTGDISPKWSRIMEILDEQEGLASLSGPSAFNDPDMLEVGNGKLSAAENRAHFSLWCVLNAPLMLGNDLRQIPADTLAIISNKEVIALNQDLLCRQAEKVADTGDIEVFTKPLANGDLGVCVLNRGASPEKVAVKWVSLGLEPGSSVTARDLWTHKDIGSFSGPIEISVPSHDVVVYRLSKPATP
jgi:alpha-galactosidase